MNTEDRRNRILDEVAEMLQGVGAATGMNALHALIEALLIVHKQLLAALPGEYRAVLKQELLNIIMIHVLSPFADAHEAQEYMGAFAVSHMEPCDASVRLGENGEEGGEV